MSTNGPTAAHDDQSHGAETEKSSAGGPAGEESTASAIWVPLIALGLLGVAIWFGSTPLTGPVVEPVVPPRPAPAAAVVDPLPSWNDGPAKKAILDFVAAVTREGSDTFVPPAERVAVFDHDGTLICEKPLAHGMFLVDRIRALAERRPEIADEEPYATLLTGDYDLVRRLGRQQLVELTFATLAGESPERIEADAMEFIRTARHPLFGVPLGETCYQPMRELIRLLEARGFAVWICSGSGLNFLRPASAEWHGIVPERVIASRPATSLREAAASVGGSAGGSVEGQGRDLELVVLPELRVFNDRAQKPVSIAEQIGRRPILAAGNVGTGGDIEMLRWSQGGPRPGLQLLVLHDDDDREMAYGEPRSESLEAAARHGWQVVRMKTDWNRVFPLPLAKTLAKTGPTAPQQAVVPSPPPVAPTAAAPAPAPMAVEAAPPTRWEEELAALTERDRAAAPRTGGICLLGSSNISTWQTLAEDFPGLDVVNRGVPGCRLSELADHLGPLLEPVRPRLVVVAAGTNDVADGRTAEEVQAAFARVVEEIGRITPGARIVYLGISPTLKRWEQWPRQQEANAAILAWIDRKATPDPAAGPARDIVYLDAAAAFLGADGRPAPECFLADGQHPSTIGNARRAAVMRPVLADRPQR